MRWPVFEALNEALTDRIALGGSALAAMMLVWASGVEASAGDGGGGAMMVGERSPTRVEERVRTGYLEDEAVCGFWTERLLAALYHLVAGRPNMERVQGIPASRGSPSLPRMPGASAATSFATRVANRAATC